MFRSSRYETPTQVSLKIPWDKNTARGFLGAMIFMVLFYFFAPVIKVERPNVRDLKIETVPVELLSFGMGDGTGRSAGNLTREGEANKGPESSSKLEDAKKAAKTNPATKDIDEAGQFVAKNELSAEKKAKEREGGSDNKNVGKRDGSNSGTGLGGSGIGEGAGYGFGDIEWGGGGNRIVVDKKVPRYPSGVNTSARIKIRFTVLPDGTVGRMIPLQKADPRLERAAMDALRQWRFNPLEEKDKVMVGVIPISFVVE